MLQVPDLEQRQLAIDVTQSFIVQAPAGSGKTELLTQRILALLTTVSQPEQILAITFTRKAAGEMRQRLVSALENCKNPEPELAHAKQTWQLANRVLQHSEQQQWGLLNNPNRLRIQTIDAFSNHLVKQLPVLSQLGCFNQISENAGRLYMQAAADLMASLESDAPWQPYLAKLLLHLDNNYQKLQNLFVGMLGCREQWLPYIIHARNTEDLRIQLEQSLSHIADETVSAIKQLWPNSLDAELLPLLEFATSQLAEDSEFAELISFDSDTDEIQLWQTLGNFLLTKDKSWRKQINKNIGFPAGAKFKAQKEAMKNILSQLTEHDALRNAFEQASLCPDTTYSEAQWEIVECLLELLPILTAQLKLTFNKMGAIDFVEISSSAQTALGSIDQPEEIALKLDYQLKHILVDEFQDTSINQFRLLEKLTAGWEPDDDRTLFLVGDPMQSIYRFRQAEVGLFLRAQDEGLGNVTLTSLQLSANFRSSADIINWVNQRFAKIMPAQADYNSGAVPYSQACAVLPATGTVTTHASANPADTVISLINDAKSQNPTGNIAILVRARSHLTEIIHALNEHSIEFQAVELESLASCAVIQDLYALTAALLHLGDRIAWLAILRAPWCGLSLEDLMTICHATDSLCIAEQIQSCDWNLLSNSGKARLTRVWPILLAAQNAMHRHSALASLIEDTWHALGGPACYDSELAIVQAKQFFNLLRQLQNQPIFELSELEQRIQSLYAKNTQNSAVQIMTVHKSKGLEFDTVIIPGLDKRAPVSKSPLLMWAERPQAHTEIDFILAPIKHSSSSEDKIFNYLRNQDTLKSDFEASRLLYVAITRAKHACHLVYTPTFKDNLVCTPISSSLLFHLWPHIDKPEQSHDENKFEHENEDVTQPIQHLGTNWRNPLPFALASQHNPIPETGYVYTLEVSKLIGTLSHRILKQIVSIGLDHYTLEQIDKLRIDYAILQAGIPKSELAFCESQIKTAIKNSLTDPRGRWILTDHPESHAEYAMTFSSGGELTEKIMDRTFIENQTRWIIDYKIVTTAVTDQAEFLQQQRQLYQQQLNDYASLFSGGTNEPIRLGLYFPLQTAWCEWEYEEHHER